MGLTDLVVQGRTKADKLDICFHLLNFLGGGDWGLSCAKDYYTITEPLDKICDKSERIRNTRFGHMN